VEAELSSYGLAVAFDPGELDASSRGLMADMVQGGVRADRPGRLGRAGWRPAVESLEGIALMVPTFLGAPLLRRAYNRWGTNKGEGAATMPGDEFVPSPKLSCTRSITIDAPPGDLWRWLCQIGQGRGGLYSYEVLENLIGCQMHNADAIIEDLQHLDVGDLVRLGPNGYPAFRVVRVDPPRSLVLLSAEGDAHGVAPTPVLDDGRPVTTWAWSLTPRGRARTRLVARQRMTFPGKQSALWHLIEPLGFVMERRMLLGLKQRAETRPRLRLEGVPCSLIRSPRPSSMDSPVDRSRRTASWKRSRSRS
jgi:hypothetical protein